MKRMFLWAVCLLACLPAAAQSKLVKTKITDYITMGIPEDFTVMPGDVYQKKYGTNRVPLAIYTSPDGKVDLGINDLANRFAGSKRYSASVAKSDWRAEDLKILQSMYKGSIMSMHQKVDFIQDKMETINKRDFIVFEFVGTVRDLDTEGRPSGREMKQYSYIQYTVYNNQILIFNFTCPFNLSNYHRETAKKLMQSIKIK